MNKVYTLHDAVAKFVESGDCISFGGFTTNRKPYAAVAEILRQGQKDFTVWAGPAGGDWDMLIGEGRVKAYINCYTANSGYTNVSRRFRAAIEKGELQYDGLVSFEKDTEGHITAVRSNMAAFNHLQAEILDTVLTRISQVPTGDLSIPIGSLTGSTLLAGRGPRITVRMESVGSSEANFRNAFTSAGINQTKHQIILTVDVSVSVLLPGFRTATKVSNSFIVAETVIVGTVPDTYTYFSTDPDTYEEDLKDYILNNS